MMGKKCTKISIFRCARIPIQMALSDTKCSLESRICIFNKFSQSRLKDDREQGVRIWSKQGNDTVNLFNPFSALSPVSLAHQLQYISRFLIHFYFSLLHNFLTSRTRTVYDRKSLEILQPSLMNRRINCTVYATNCVTGHCVNVRQNKCSGTQHELSSTKFRFITCGHVRTGQPQTFHVTTTWSIMCQVR